jgi:glycosyltransferase involved in cell wall biosynthesis
MATYNGEQYIKEQLDSIFRQTQNCFHVVVCDDCSTDATWEILREYASRHPGEITLSQNKVNRGGAAKNFLDMISQYRHSYVMLCDQDDIWKPDKIALSLAAIQKEEKRIGAHTPILLHTDLEVVDARLHTIAKSFVTRENIVPDLYSLEAQTIQNTVTGCTVMMNRALVDLVRMPGYCMMHDWWLGLIASAFGRRLFLPRQTVLYRQHGQNSIGSTNTNTLLFQINKVIHARKKRRELFERCYQADSFLTAYSDILSHEQKAFLSEMAALPTYGKLKRWRIFNELKPIKSTNFHRLAQLLYI